MLIITFFSVFMFEAVAQVTPPVPTAIVTYESIWIRWSPSGNGTDIPSYNIYSNGIRIGTVYANNPGGTQYIAGFNNGGGVLLTPNTLYSYTVTAVDAAGNESAQSAPSVFTSGFPDSKYKCKLRK